MTCLLLRRFKGLNIDIPIGPVIQQKTQFTLRGESLFPGCLGFVLLFESPEAAKKVDPNGRTLEVNLSRKGEGDGEGRIILG